MGQADGQGHQLGCLVACIAEHDPLIAGANQIQRIASVVVGFIHTLSDVGRLLVKGNQDSTAVGIKATGASPAIANLLDHIANKVDEVHLRFGCHFACDHAKASVHNCFAGHTAGGILRQKGVEYGITDLIADLVGMPLRHGFRGKNVSTHGHRSLPATLRGRLFNPLPLRLLLRSVRSSD